MASLDEGVLLGGETLDQVAAGHSRDARLGCHITGELHPAGGHLDEREGRRRGGESSDVVVAGDPLHPADGLCVGEAQFPGSGMNHEPGWHPTADALPEGLHGAADAGLRRQGGEDHRHDEQQHHALSDTPADRQPGAFHQ